MLPKLTSQLVNKQYLLAVYNKTIWVPHQDEAKIRNCPRPPTMNVLVNKLLQLASRHNLNTGINVNKKNWPDRDWTLLAIATINPLDEIFSRDYVPPALPLNNVVADLLVPHNQMLQGMEHVFVGKKRDRKGIPTTLLTKD